jgi:hypothetical protein
MPYGDMPSAVMRSRGEVSPGEGMASVDDWRYRVRLMAQTKRKEIERK